MSPAVTAGRTGSTPPARRPALEETAAMARPIGFGGAASRRARSEVRTPQDLVGEAPLCLPGA